MFEQFNFMEKGNRSTTLWMTFVWACIIWTCFEAPLSFALSKQLQQHHLWWDGFFSIIFFTDIYFRLTKKLRLPAIAPRFTRDGKRIQETPYHKSGWFAVDLVTSIPYDIVASFFGLHIVSTTILSLRLLRMLRILRLRSIFEVIDFLPRYAKIILGLTAISLTIHWIACGWMIINPRTDLDIVSYYNVSLYWTITTLTTVGYGDITPATNLGRVYTMFVMIIGVASYGIIIGNFSRMIMIADRYKEEKKEKMNSLMQYLNHYNIPKGLQKQTLMFYTHLLTQNISQEDEKVVKDLPRALQNELNLYKKIKLLKNVHIFKDCSIPCLKLIATKLHQTFHSPNEFVIKKGDVGEEMFIIGHGEFEVSTGEKVLANLKDGQFFGETALLENTIRNSDVVSKSYCDLYSFTKEDFLEVIAKYPDLEEKFQSKYKRRKTDQLKAA